MQTAPLSISKIKPMELVRLALENLLLHPKKMNPTPKDPLVVLTQAQKETFVGNGLYDADAIIVFNSLPRAERRRYVHQVQKLQKSFNT